MVAGVSGDHGTQEMLPGLELSPLERSMVEEMSSKRRQIGWTGEEMSINGNNDVLHKGVSSRRVVSVQTGIRALCKIVEIENSRNRKRVSPGRLLPYRLKT